MRATWVRTLAAALVGAVGVVGSGGGAAQAAAPRQVERAAPHEELSPRVVGIVELPGGGGYWVSDARGAVAGFGAAPFVGSGAGMALTAPVVAMAADPTASGYWLAQADGGVLTFGQAGFFGSAADDHLSSPVVGMAVTPDGGGYWLVEADWSVLAFGDALPFGTVPGVRPAAPAVGIASTPDGQGYWLAGADGTVQAFGTAIPSATAEDPGGPVVGIASTPDGGGYWLATASGAVGAFGDAGAYASAGPDHPVAPIVGIARTPDGGGYWLVGADGGVFAFGDAPYLGGVPLAPSEVRIGIFGDSLATQARGYFTYLAGGVGLQVVAFTFGGTAVCDALPAIAADAELLHLSAAVVQFSGDDGTPCMDGIPAGSPQFFARYRHDIEQAIAILTGAGVRVYLVGAPPTSTSAGSANLEELNQMYAGLAAGQPEVDYVDAGAAVTNDGQFTWRMTCLPIEECDGPDGTNVVRSPDGVHFCPGTADLSGRCSVYASGAFRFAAAMLAPVSRALGR